MFAPRPDYQDSRVKNVRKVYSTGTDRRFASTDELFMSAYAKAGMQTPPPGKKAFDNTKNATMTASREPSDRESTTISYNNSDSRIYNSNLSLQAKSRSLQDGWGFFIHCSWSFGLYLFWQLPFAMLGLLFLGLAAGIEGMMTESLSTGVLKDAAAATASIFGWIVGYENITELPITIYFMTSLIIIFVGWGTMITLTLISILAGWKPLSGTRSTSKLLWFMFGMGCYTLPLFDLFPWFLPWLIVVWRNPE